MNLHSKGPGDFIKELNKKKEKEIEELDDRLILESEKKKLVQRIKARFSRLVKDTDQSLFLKQNDILG